MIESRLPYEISLNPNTAAAPCARLVLKDRLTEWGLTELLEDSSTVAGELVANAARLGQVFAVRLTPEDGALLIEVVDSSPDEPQIKDVFGDSDREGGRGLLIVDALAAGWGVRRENGQKVVWARVAP
ncbi:ATP-binding protein [Actinoallomurus purpureus]|uniref:ATP-binding protein n=1 Tax=Actinoallomurus purpureus TaxID=478114 RepID=UPI00209345DC|nr:ATP-binding protein [Actinoallomurus purpureus]MCO6005987.1 ATP-binding protein [Actinoallomurus purpureus]